MNLWFWLRRPHKIPAQLRYRAWLKRNPDKPWLTPEAVAFCETALVPDMIGVEFGSGRSTPWFARRLARLTSVEHDQQWYSRVKLLLEQAGLHNVDYRWVPSEPPGAADDPPRYAAVLNEVADGSIDLIVVDGHYRDACLTLAPAKLKPGGFLLVDDTGYWPNLWPTQVPAGWHLVHDSTNGIKSARVWRKPG